MVKLAISQMAFDLQDNREIFSFMKNHQFTGLEILPTKIVPKDPYDNLPIFKSFDQKLNSQFKISIISMQSLTYGKKENIFDSDYLINYLKKAIYFAGQLGIQNLVFGSPKNRIIPKDYSQNKMINIFKDLGDYALKNNTTFSIEPNPYIYGGNFILTTKEAIDLIKDIKCDGLKVNIDLGTIIQNKENLAKILQNNLKYINHIHISEPYLRPIQNRKILFDILKDNLKNYHKYLSIEMANPNNLDLIKKCILEIESEFTNVIDNS